MIVLINASAAKYGGAKAIVEKFVEETDFNSYDKVYLLAPEMLRVKNDKVHKINIETTGIMTLLFSTLFVVYWVLKLKASKLISFNNLNLVIPIVDRVTYFHMPHTFYKKTLKHKIYRFVISKLLDGTRFVVQTEFVKSEFLRVFGYKHSLFVNWPGCQKPKRNKEPMTLLSNVNTKNNKRLKCIIPIIDTNSVHKNFDFFVKRINEIAFLNIDFFITSDKGPELSSVSYIGVQSREKLDDIYHEMDFMLFPSVFETVGLPIFEFSSLGKPVLVLNMPYLRGIENTVELTSNIVLFDEFNFKLKVMSVVENYDSHCVPEFGYDHLVVKSNWSALIT